MRIACCSNYSLAEAGRLYLDGRYPRQGLYGAAGLAKRRSRVQPVRKARADRLLPDSARDRPTVTSIGKSGRDRGGHSARSDRCRLKDALAMGKPVVITKSPHIDVDVEAIGCGFTVALGDVDGWTDALEKLRDPAVATAAGSRGRAWAERHWNADVATRRSQRTSREPSGRPPDSPLWVSQAPRDPDRIRLCRRHPSVTGTR